MKTTQSILKTFAVLVISVICFSNSFGQYQERSFDTKCNNLSGNDNGRAIINRLDNGYAIAGYNYLPVCGIGPMDWLFTRLTPTGTHLATRLIGTPADDKCYSVVQLNNDTGYVLAGHMYGIPGLDVATLVKLNKSSGLLFARQINDTVSSKYFQVVKDPGSTTGYTGYIERPFGMSRTAHKILVSQYNPAPALNWARRLDTYLNVNTPSRSHEEAVSLCYQPAAGPCYGIAAKTNRFGKNSGWDIMIVKVNYMGNVVWNKIYRLNLMTNPYPTAYPSKIIPMSDGGFTVVGVTSAYGNQADIIVLRVNVTGALMWSYTYGTTFAPEQGLSIVQDGANFVITGSCQPTASSPDALLMKIPVTGGAPVWTKSWDDGNAGYETGFDVINSTVSAPGGYAITGETNRGPQALNHFLWRTNDDGQIPGMNCQDSIILPWFANQHVLDSLLIKCVKLTDRYFNPQCVDPNVVTNTYCLSAITAPDPEGTELDSRSSEVTNYALKQNYPNPFNPSTKIQYELPVEANVTIKIFDAAGKEVMTLVNENKPQGRYEAEFNGSMLSSGIYYYKLTSGSFSEVKKMILLK